MASFLIILVSLSVSGSITAGVLLLVNAGAGKALGRRLYSLMWLVVLLRLVLPVTAGTNLMASALALLTPEEQSVQQAPEAYAAPEQPFLDGYGAEYTQPVRETPIQADGGGTGASAPAVGKKLNMSMLLTSEYFWFALWSVGAVAALLRRLLPYALFSRRVKRTAMTPEPEELEIFEALYTGRRVKLLRSELVPSPALMGVIKPVVVLPASSDDLTEVRYALMHELAHYRRGDVALKLIAALIFSVHWFNPLMLVFQRELASACELGCDEAVVSELDAIGRRRYVETLLRFAEASAIPAVGMSFGVRDLQRRISSVVGYRRRTARTAVLSVALALLVTGCALGAGAVTSPEGAPEQSPIVSGSFADIPEGVQSRAEELLIAECERLSAQYYDGARITDFRRTGEYTASDGTPVDIYECVYELHTLKADAVAISSPERLTDESWVKWQYPLQLASAGGNVLCHTFYAGVVQIPGTAAFEAYVERALGIEPTTDETPQPEELPEYFQSAVDDEYAAHHMMGIMYAFPDIDGDGEGELAVKRLGSMLPSVAVYDYRDGHTQKVLDWTGRMFYNSGKLLLISGADSSAKHVYTWNGSEFVYAAYSLAVLTDADHVAKYCVFTGLAEPFYALYYDKTDGEYDYNRIMNASIGGNAEYYCSAAELEKYVVDEQEYGIQWSSVREKLSELILSDEAGYTVLAGEAG